MLRAAPFLVVVVVFATLIGLPVALASLVLRALPAQTLARRTAVDMTAVARAVNTELTATLAASKYESYVQPSSPGRNTGPTYRPAASSRQPAVGLLSLLLQAYVMNKGSGSAISEPLPPLPAVECSRSLRRQCQFSAQNVSSDPGPGDVGDSGSRFGRR